MSRRLLITTIVSTPDQPILATTKVVSFPDEFGVSQAIRMLEHKSTPQVTYHAVKLYYPSSGYTEE